MKNMSKPPKKISFSLILRESVDEVTLVHSPENVAQPR